MLIRFTYYLYDLNLCRIIVIILYYILIVVIRLGLMYLFNRIDKILIVDLRVLILREKKYNLHHNINQDQENPYKHGIRYSINIAHQKD